MKHVYFVTWVIIGQEDSPAVTYGDGEMWLDAPLTEETQIEEFKWNLQAKRKQNDRHGKPILTAPPLFLRTEE